MLDSMVLLNDGGKVAGLGFEIISKLDSYFLMAVMYHHLIFGLKSLPD